MMANVDPVVFTINGKVHKISGDVAIETSLNTYIRDYARLKATKFMCLEGGCGSCIVTARIENPSTKKATAYAVNSVSKIQKHPYLLESGKPSKKDVEQAFGGNICRCTGYRPILDAFTSLASDAPKICSRAVCDIEDIVKHCEGEDNASCEGASYSSSPGTDDSLEKNNYEKYIIEENVEVKEKSDNDEEEEEDYESNFESYFVELALAPQNLTMKDKSGKEFYYVKTKKEIFELLDMVGSKKYELLSGGTAKGVYKNDFKPQVYIDITKVTELRKISVSGVIELGANVTLTETLNFFLSISKQRPAEFGYTSVLADHIKQIASVPVRNVGSIAGNLSIKHRHQEFRSDVFLILETVGAQLRIGYCSHSQISKRAQNAISYVNAGFLFQLNRESKFRVIGKPNIVYGGISRSFIHASNTEKFLIGKNLLDNKTLQGALAVLSNEVNPAVDELDASTSYRKGLAVSLFYKFVLSLVPSGSSVYSSGGTLLERPLSSGSVKFESNDKLSPVTKPIPKLEIELQCSGELEYVNDMPNIEGQRYCAFVLSTVANAKLKSIDASQILKQPGVYAFYTAKDIPGKNTYQLPLVNSTQYEQLLADGKVEYAGQPVGLVVAETMRLAEHAANQVKVEYSDVKPPILSVKEILNKGPKGNIIPQGEIPATAKKNDVKHVVKGEVELAKQYHFPIEPQTSFCVPTNGGQCMTVYSSTQWPQIVQCAISLALGIPDNSVYVKVRAVGGGYGFKFSRANLSATACAVAAYLQQKPMRMVMTIESMMKAIGKRFPLLLQYEAGVDNDGLIQYMNISFYEDVGITINDANCLAVLVYLPGSYDPSTWSRKGFAVKTNSASNCYCRAPGSTEATASIETIMEHISRVVKKDPLSVRLKNIINPIAADLLNTLKVSSDYDKRKEAIEKFNSENRWKKRGLSLITAGYPKIPFNLLNAAISIYELDGTVAISHGGIEIGQGINTKVAQVAAYTLGIDIKLIKIYPSNTFVSPNNIWTGNSQTSQSVCSATVNCCKIILERLDPIKSKMKNPTWLELIKAAYNANVDLHASSSWKAQDTQIYPVEGVCVSEVELDILTGQHLINRVDIIQDCGQSLNPKLDIGQVQGAFVMGLGYYLIEELIYNSKTGQILTDRTWNYTPPGALDIPVDFRVALTKKGDSPAAIFGSKAIGEPPLLLSASFLFAFRKALDSARKDAGLKEEWFEIRPPLTPEFTYQYCANSIKQYRI
ncbi:indole-3-acetaldehyde oxidase [Nilaparvata lugens]|uniref:indole-3-acetaldehyde oxidase n=1 Tax=Nilaparvata lugens TaxID=108931 RepID=UPI00193D0860|nr:indole-3-acetaldehyde oxidase [Nilaparvata lugens]